MDDININGVFYAKENVNREVIIIFKEVPVIEDESLFSRTHYFRDKEIIGYKFVNLGKMMESIAKGVDANEALEAARGQYGRVDDAAQLLDPRHN